MFILYVATVVVWLLGMIAQATAADPKFVRAWGLPLLALGLYGWAAILLLVATGVLPSWN